MNTTALSEVLAEMRRRDIDADLPALWAKQSDWAARIESALASAEPVAWIRFLPDGLYEGPVHKSRFYDYYRKSGKWTPLYAHAQAAAKVEALKWAQGLIEQLPANHDGRNSWLVNHGVGDESDWLRAEWKRYADECHDYYCSGPMDGPKPERRRYPVSASPASVPDGVYLSGPMSGLQDLNFPAFHAAAKELRANGHRVISPAEINAAHPGEWASCMRADIRALCDCETLALLPGWESSRGAHLELHIAHRLGLKIVSVAGLMFTTPEPTP